MPAGAAADGFLWYVYDGCLSGGDMSVQRRPYHRNCKCALHKSKHNCAHGLSRCTNMSYPIRRSWSEGCLALAAASCHSSPSPSSSPSLQLVGGRASHVVWSCNEEDAEQACPLHY